MERTHYTQLTLEERYHIQVMRKQGKSLRSIAIGMGRSHSTLSREFLRNHGGRGGSPGLSVPSEQSQGEETDSGSSRLYSGENPAPLESGTGLWTSPD